MGSIVLLLVAGFVLFTAAMLALWVKLWQRSRSDDLLVDLDAEVKEITTLSVAKQRTLQDIRDLEFDYSLGHLSEADYTALRQKLERQAIQVMKRLDRLRGSTDFDALIDRGYAERFGVDPADAPGSLAEVAPEAEAAAPAKPAPAAAKPATVAAGSAKPAHAAKPAPAASADETRPCPGCSRAMDRDALFCSGCGTSLPPLTPPRPTACKACEAPLDEDARFCKQCGAPVEEVTP